MSWCASTGRSPGVLRPKVDSRRRISGSSRPSNCGIRRSRSGSPPTPQNHADAAWRRLHPRNPPARRRIACPAPSSPAPPAEQDTPSIPTCRAFTEDRSPNNPAPVRHPRPTPGRAPIVGLARLPWFTSPMIPAGQSGLPFAAAAAVILDAGRVPESRSPNRRRSAARSKEDPKDLVPKASKAVGGFRVDRLRGEASAAKPAEHHPNTGTGLAAFNGVTSVS